MRPILSYIFWRVMLAISLVAGLVAPVAAAMPRGQVTHRGGRWDQAGDAVPRRPAGQPCPRAGRCPL